MSFNETEGRLTSREMWERWHGPSGATRLAALQRRIVGRRAHQFFQMGGLLNHVLFDGVLRRYLPSDNGLSIIEIGCAPAKLLVRFRRTFGYEPYGVEYSENGISKSRETFATEGLDCDRIVRADFFDHQFHSENAGRFDVVASFGFIEHFDDPREVVRKHIALLRPGGWVVVTIPNLSGLNRMLFRFFNDEHLAEHNLGIMTLERFRALFDLPRLETHFCNLVGPFTFSLFNTRPHSWKRHLFLAAQIAERPWQLLRWKVWGARYVRHRWCSPYLVFIGRKA